MWKVRILRDSYLRGRIPYTPVYLSVYILYTDGIRRCTDVVWKVRIRDSYIRGRISYSSLHMTYCIHSYIRGRISYSSLHMAYCILHKAGSVLVCPCTGFLLAWQDWFIISHDRINNVYRIKQEEY